VLASLGKLESASPSAAVFWFGWSLFADGVTAKLAEVRAKQTTVKSAIIG
jgi:hypothetical protein